MVKRILVVDDKSDVCFALEKVLREEVFVVDSYEHPLVALDKFKPHLYGFALYRQIKRLDKKVKVCFLTAGEMCYGVNQDISSVPANCFIRKPIENEELLKRINEIIIHDTTVWIRSK